MTRKGVVPAAAGLDAAGSGSLELQGIEKRFGEAVAVAKLDLALESGEFLTLLGPSGSGKTTTLAMIAGFENPDRGRIVLDGRDVTGLPTHRRQVGVVFQNYALFPHMTVAENVAFPLKMRRLSSNEARKRVAEALDLVRLTGLGGRYPRQLSGGQQQRVAVARATVYRPSLLLMDEPLSALDKNLRESLQLELRRLHRDLRTSFMYVTHDQGEALALSDRIVVMREGRIEQVGTPSEVYGRPQSVFTAQFLGQSNFLEGEVDFAEASGSTAVVRLKNGMRIFGTPSVPVRRGDSVAVLIRPEDLVLNPPADQMKAIGPDQATIRVRIKETVYLGDAVRCRGVFDTGEEVTMRLSLQDATSAASGDPVAIGWNPDRAVVIAHQPSQSS